MRRLTTLIRLAVPLLLLAALQFQVPAAQSSECTEGQYKTETVGPVCGCEDGLSTPKERYQCIGGQWEYLSSFCAAPFCRDEGGGGGGDTGGGGGATCCWWHTTCRINSNGECEYVPTYCGQWGC